MATYSSALVATNTPPGTGHGIHRMSTHLHSQTPTYAGWVAGDIHQIGWLPPNAVVVSAWMKSSAQLDTGVAALTFSMGVVGNPALWKSVITTVGRAAGNGGVTADTTMLAPGMLYKNTTGVKQMVILTVGTSAATPALGFVEVDVEWFLEAVPASAP